MSFSIAPANSPLPPSPRGPKAPLAPLGKVFRTRNPVTGVKHVCGALTSDGEWIFEQQEDERTTWSVGHFPTRTVVAEHLGTLEDCRAYAGSPRARADLRLKLAGAHDRGDHQAPREECPGCQAEIPDRTESILTSSPA